MSRLTRLLIPTLGLLAFAIPAMADETEEDVAIRGALDLPSAAQRARRAGVEDVEVKEALKANKDRKVKADEAAKVLDEGAKASEESGPIDNFGGFVNEQLDAGLRGKDLADAIHAEHAARGKGKGHDKDKGKDKGDDKDKGHGDKDHGDKHHDDDDHGVDEDHGAGGEHGSEKKSDKKGASSDKKGGPHKAAGPGKKGGSEVPAEKKAGASKKK